MTSTRIKTPPEAIPKVMKDEVLRALARVAEMLVGNFTVSFQNELRIMAEVSGSQAARVMREQGIPMQQAVRHTAGAVAKL